MTLVTRQAMTDDGGTFTTGTVVNEAFVDQVYDQIDDQAHSTTNPTVKPKATTDEVVAARGSKASLDARLDVSLEEDGTLKTQASLVTVAQVQSLLGGRNVALNGDLDTWTAGGAAAPDNFTLSGAGATIARTGIGMADTFHFGTGSGFAAKITRVGNDAKLTQAVIASADFAKYTNAKSQKVGVAVKAKTAIASHLRITVDDGVTTTSSSYHTGGNTEEHLSVSHTLSGTATKLDVYVEVNGSNGDAYVGGFVVVFADLAPSDWSPLSAVNDASATVRGVVNIGTQTLAGAKTFSTPPIFNQGGAATADATVSGRIHTNITSVGNVGAGVDDLMSYSLPANSLNAAGKAVRITAWGTFFADAGSKMVQLLFGATTLVSRTTTSFNGGNWRITALVVYNSPTTQVAFGEVIGVNAADTVLGDQSDTTPAETVSGAIVIKAQATGTANNDVVQKGMIVEVVG